MTLDTRWFPPMQWTVYGYQRPDGSFAYIGFTGQPHWRQRQHEGKSAWLTSDLRFVAIEQHPTIDEARAREAELIAAHRPIFNVTHNPDKIRPRRAPAPAPGPKEILWQPGEWKPLKARSAA